MCGLNVVIGELDIWRGSPDHPVYHSIDWESWPAGPTGLCPALPVFCAPGCGRHSLAGLRGRLPALEAAAVGHPLVICFP